METATIILLTVLSTLSVVAIITMVVVTFSKLRGKVDELENSVFKYINEKEVETFKIIQDNENETRSRFDGVNFRFVELERGIDSRFDKLSNKIQLSNATGPVANVQKQVLQG